MKPRPSLVEQVEGEEVTEREHVSLVRRRACHGVLAEGQPLQHLLPGFLVGRQLSLELQPSELVHTQALERPLDERALVDPLERFPLLFKTGSKNMIHG